MATPSDISAQFREIYLEGTWVIGTNLKDVLKSISWTNAIATIGKHNSIAALTYHLQYYIKGVQQVLEGGSLDTKDVYSFDLDPIDSQEKWVLLRDSMVSDLTLFADTVASLPEASLSQAFVDPKYGSLERNLQVIIEHGYYHFGQIVMLTKLIPSEEQAARQ